MTLFGNDKEQDQRINALELHLRQLSDVVQQNQMDLAALQVQVLTMQQQVGEKMSMQDLDPSIVSLNDQIAQLRSDVEEVSDAAADTWAPLNKGITDSLSKLRENVQKLSETQD